MMVMLLVEMVVVLLLLCEPRHSLGHFGYV